MNVWVCEYVYVLLCLSREWGVVVKCVGVCVCVCVCVENEGLENVCVLFYCPVFQGEVA